MPYEDWSRIFLYLRRAHNSPLVFTPVHTKHFIAMSFQSSPCFHDELAQSLHLLCHLVHWVRKQVLNRLDFTLPLIGNELENLVSKYSYAPLRLNCHYCHSSDTTVTHLLLSCKMVKENGKVIYCVTLMSQT